MKHPVVIVDYDHRWPVIYEEKKAEIMDVIGHKVEAIEHIGSTAVPGLGAKPIVDMIAGVRDLDEAEECVRLLRERLGYIDITPEPDETEWFFCIGDKTKPEERNKIHLHLVKYESYHWRKHILFRDFLRTHPDVANEYYELKKKLAEKYGSDREGYTDAKNSFIESVLNRMVDGNHGQGGK
jgi:GrpB-like predicted nucleotidyltransferase (UPF0157 family)